MKFEVFGKELIVERKGSGWVVFQSAEGKRWPVRDLVIPDFVTELDLSRYLADLFHESASPEHPDVRRVD